jgi:hypothetical protein
MYFDPAEITIRLGVSTRFFAEMRNFFPPWEAF